MVSGDSVEWINSTDEYFKKKEDYEYSILGIMKEKAFNGI